MEAIEAKIKKIKCAIFDVDGVLTDGTLYYTDSTTDFKAFHAHDGLGIKMLQESGIKVAIITSHDSPMINRRMQALEIEHVYQGKKDKTPSYEDLLAKLNLVDEDVCYVGDDLPDLPLIRRAGLGITVANGVPLVKQHADWQTDARGGSGAVREICEYIMRTQNTLDQIHKKFLA